MSRILIGGCLCDSGYALDNSRRDYGARRVDLILLFSAD